MAQPHEKVTQSKRHIIINNFVGGIAWGLGVTIGLSIVLALLGILANVIGLVPFIGEFVKDIIEYINQSTPNIR